jgi:benzoate membrane transport protein
MLRLLPPIPAWSSALIAALVGFGGTVALVVQALRTLGASVEQTSSGVTALCLGIAAGGAVLSYRLRMPIVLAWSTPGAALLAVSASGLDWPTAVGVFVAVALMTIALGLVPMFGRLAERIPASIAAAMLAGVLFPFCLDLFRLAAVDPLLVAVVLVVFAVARQRVPLYALLLVLAADIGLALVRGQLGALPAGPTLGSLEAVLPSFDMRAIVSIGLPLFLVTLVSQNLGGLMVLRSAGYAPRTGVLLAGSGVASLLAAPFGGFAVNLAAITAAICTNRDAHPDATQRWVVGLLYAGFYVVLAAFAPALVRLFLALPEAVIAVLIGTALIPALLGAMEVALRDTSSRDAAVLTLLATASGLTLFGLGSAFWGLGVGVLALGVKRLVNRA